MALGGRSWDEWIAQYAASHTNPVNRVCHTVGIPLIALSIPLFLVAIWVPGFWRIPLTLFVAGWVFQFVGHAFEEAAGVLQDWRFLFVGLRWWVAKLQGRA
jgi:uncharacterized membrane protein YGL010W